MEDKEKEVSEIKTYTQEDLDKILKEKEVVHNLEKEALSSKTSELEGKLTSTNEQLDKVIKNIEAEKLERMSAEEKEKHIKDLARKEKAERDRIDAENNSKKQREIEEQSLINKKILAEAKRKELAVDNDIPKDLRKYIIGDDEESIILSIEQIKKDFNLNSADIEAKVKKAVDEKLKNGGVAFDNGIGTETNVGIKLDDFIKMDMTQKQALMSSNPELFKKYRQLQLENRK